jgi:hypothetical protein
LRNNVRISMNETLCNPESFQFWAQIAIHRSKLPFFLWLALPDANRAGRIAFPNGFLDWEKFRSATQRRAARNVKDFVIGILGYGYKSRSCRRIRRARWCSSRGKIVRFAENNAKPSGTAAAAAKAQTRTARREG